MHVNHLQRSDLQKEKKKLKKFFFRCRGSHGFGKYYASIVVDLSSIPKDYLKRAGDAIVNLLLFTNNTRNISLATRSFAHK